MNEFGLPTVVQAAIRYWWLFLIQGLVALAVGAVLVFNPDKSINVVAVLLGIYVILWGLVQLVTAAVLAGSRLLHVAIGVLAVIAGGVVVSSPGDSVELIVVLIGIYLILWGIYAVLALFGDRPDKVARVLSGIVAAAAGIIVIAWPGPSIKVVAVVFGIWLMVSGLIDVFGSLRLRSLGRQI